MVIVFLHRNPLGVGEITDRCTTLPGLTTLTCLSTYLLMGFVVSKGAGSFLVLVCHIVRLALGFACLLRGCPPFLIGSTPPSSSFVPPGLLGSVAPEVELFACLLTAFIP